MGDERNEKSQEEKKDVQRKSVEKDVQRKDVGEDVNKCRRHITMGLAPSCSGSGG